MIARDVPLDILELNEFGIIRAKSEDTIQGRQQLHQLRQQHQILHPIEKKIVDSDTKYVRENLQDLLLKAVSVNDEIFQDKIQKILAVNKFNHSLRYYRDHIKNPFTLSRKIFNIVLDPNGEYKRVKSQQKIYKKKVEEFRKKEQLIRANQIMDKFGGSSAHKDLTTTIKLTGNVKRKMTLSKSVENLTKHNVIDFTQLSSQLQQDYQFPNPDSFPQECAPNQDIFVKQSLQQQNSTTFYKNNYAYDLIKPNKNLSQYQQKEQNEKKNIQKKLPNLSYLFEKPKNIIIIDSKRGYTQSKFNQTSNTFVTSMAKSPIRTQADEMSPMQRRVQQLQQSKLPDQQLQQTILPDQSPMKSQQVVNTSMSMINLSMNQDMNQAIHEQSMLIQNQDLDQRQIDNEEEASSFQLPMSSKRTSITSMDTDKMIRLNMEADKEILDTQLITTKLKRQKYFIKHKRQPLSAQKEMTQNRFTMKPYPCYPKEQVDAYINKFKLLQRQNTSLSLQNSSRKVRVSKTDQDKEQLAVFLSYSKKQLQDMEKQTINIAEKRAVLQQQINFRLKRAQKNVLSEFSNDIEPSNDQLREIKHELKKLNSISHERDMYAIKFNRKIQVFKPLTNCKSKEEISLRQYREQFLSNIDQDGQIPSGDDDNNHFQEYTVRGQRDFPNFYKIKQNLNLLYDVPSLKETKVKFDQKIASLRASYLPAMNP